MFSEYELFNYFDEHNVSQDAREYILNVRRDGPCREVGEHAVGNVISSYTSEKMDRDFTLESHTVELVFSRMCEFDDTIHEYHHQPNTIDIFPLTVKGKRTRRSYTSDFLVLSSEGPRVVQTKSKRKLEELIEKDPLNWKMEGERYLHLPALEAFQKIGLHHQVTFLPKTAPILSVNTGLLLQAERLSESALESLLRNALPLFREKAWMSMKELRTTLGLASLGPIFSLLRSKKLHCLLDKQLLSDEESAVLSPSRDHLEEGYARFVSQRLVAGRTEIAIGDSHVPSSKQAEVALKRLDRLEENSRTGRRLRKIVADGREKGLSPFQALIPDFKGRGNKLEKMATKVSRLLLEYLDSDEHASAINTSFYNSYNQYVKVARAAHPLLRPASLRTFTRKAKNPVDPVKDARRRKGKRGANAEKPPTPTEERIIKSSVPFAIATVDHYNVDLIVVLGYEGGKPVTARCWLTALVDLASDDVLAWYFSLHPPSRVSCSMVVRDCIRRHGKVPAAIITDGGAEFRSAHFHGMLRSLGIERRRRPAADGRYGSEVERLFGAFKEERLDVLPGNIKGILHDRSTSRSHSPHKTAVLEPEDLIREFDIWVSWRRTKLIGASIRTIEEKMQQKCELYDFVGQRAVLDEATLMLTAADNKSYVVDRRRGIHTGDGPHYWHPKLSQVPDGGRVEVRKEPEDPYRIYALVNDEWVTCTSTEEAVFQQKEHISQRAEAMLFFAPHSIKNERRLEARQRLITMQGSLGTQGKPVEVEQHTENSHVLVKPLGNVFESVEVDDLDELSIGKWGTA